MRSFVRSRVVSRARECGDAPPTSNLTRIRSFVSRRVVSCTTSHDSRKSTIHPRASRCRRSVAVGRTRGDASRPVMTRTEPSTPRPHVLGGQNLPCPRPMHGPCIQKNTTSSYSTWEYASSTTVRTTEHVRHAIYIGRADPRARRRDGDDRRVRSRPPFDSTTDDDGRVRARDSRATDARATRLARADGACLERATKTRARGANRSNRSNRARI